jgi:mannose-6-phosphate isomerase-like protein (cupin superfamily)
MKVKINAINGTVIKDNETYRLEDNTYLEHLTLSSTYLKPGKQTNGHAHEFQEEIYIFTAGHGKMVIGATVHDAVQGDAFLIPMDTFHQVKNMSKLEPCAFTCVFEKYDRDGEAAQY